MPEAEDADVTPPVDAAGVPKAQAAADGHLRHEAPKLAVKDVEWRRHEGVTL